MYFISYFLEFSGDRCDFNTLIIPSQGGDDNSASNMVKIDSHLEFASKTFADFWDVSTLI